MSHYTPPVDDLLFVRDELLDFPGHYARLPGCEELDRDTCRAIIEQLADFCASEIAPLYQIGDREGCQLHADGSVTTPSGFKEAYRAFVASGWPSISGSTTYGGQGLPESLGVVMNTLLAEANWAWAMYPLLAHGAKQTLALHGSEAQKQTYLSKLISGEWIGTMCLTEPQAGSDVGLLRTRAEPQPDGSYRITGGKIFISAGENDFAENIVHIVLARLPDSPPGTKGISLFIVPKFLPTATSDIGQRNTVSCDRIEAKMGIHGNATCALNFDGATGFLIGEANKGMRYMFTFMNSARLGTAVQGLAHAERAYQGARIYAMERLQMRALSGSQAPELEADPIICHGDVRRLLLTCKAYAEGGRMLSQLCAQLLDVIERHPDTDTRQQAEKRLALLTPITKAFLTETGIEAASNGVQIFGGHGYITDNGMEQNLRDSRISTIYEGTTAIQAIDLIGRKVMADGGAELARLIEEMQHDCQQQAATQPALSQLTLAAVERWRDVSAELGQRAQQGDLDSLACNAVDYTMLAGFTVQAWLWLKAAALCADKTTHFHQDKLATAQFFFERLLPRSLAHAALATSATASVMQVDPTRLR